MNVYLSGPITNVPYDAVVGWRKLIKSDFADSNDIKLIDPMRDREYKLSDEYATDITSYIATPDGIVARDHNDVKRSSLVLCNLSVSDHVSIGSVVELTWAWNYRIPSIVIRKNDQDVHGHPMILSMANFIVYDVQHAIKLVKSILRNN